MKFKVCILDETLQEPVFMFLYKVKGWPLPENKKGNSENWASRCLDDLNDDIIECMLRFRRLRMGSSLVSMFYFDHDNDLLLIDGSDDFLNFIESDPPIKLFAFDNKSKLDGTVLWKKINAIKHKLI